MEREKESEKVPPFGTFRGQCCCHTDRRYRKLSEGEGNPF